MSSNLQYNEDRPQPPHIRFEIRAVEDREQSIQQNRPMWRDEIFIIAQPRGSVNNVIKIASEWIEDQRVKAKMRKIPEEWLDHYEKRLEAFKEGVEDKIDGTPLHHWNGISPAMLQNCLNVAVFCLEDLAVANEEVLSHIGMGGLALKKRAQAFLEAQKKDTGEEVAALRAALGDLQEQVARLSEGNERKAAKIKQLESMKT